MNRLKEKYNKEIKQILAKEFDIKNSMSIPRPVKVVVNMGVGEVAKNQQNMDTLKRDLATLTGQLPSIRNAKVSIASFSLRAGMPVGLTVTLRGERMYAFLDRLFSIVLPRLRDFRGMPVKSFDALGNYTLGLTEHTVFPEIDLSKAAAAHGMEITVVVKTGNVSDKSATNVGGKPDTNVIKSKRLLELLGMPFEKGEVPER
jgi:large subunit ribosomal protein L5